MFPSFPSLCVSTVAYSVCVPWQERGEIVQICKNIVGMFHCVAMCPETSCCAENKCERALSLPSVNASLPT